MAAPDTHQPARPSREASARLWTLALATALIGIVALPQRRGRASASSSDSPDDARQPSPSHEGGSARAVARSEPERGRQAERPTEIPAKGWKDIAKRIYRDVGENRIMLISAGVTFFALLAIVAFILADHPERNFGIWRFFMIGVLAELMSRIYHESQDRKPYKVRKTHLGQSADETNAA